MQRKRRPKSVQRPFSSVINNLTLDEAINELDLAVSDLLEAVTRAPYELNPLTTLRDLINVETDDELAKKVAIRKSREALYFAAVDFKNATKFLVKKLKNEESLPKYEANIQNTVDEAYAFITNIGNTLMEPTKEKIIETQNAAIQLLGNFALLQKDLKKQDWEYYLGSVLMVLGAGLTVLAAPMVPIFGVGIAVAAFGAGLTIIGACLTFGKTLTERRIAQMDENALAMQAFTTKTSFAKKMFLLPPKQSDSLIAEQKGKAAEKDLKFGPK